MYLHLGNDTVIRTEELVGIFDLDNASQSQITRKYLAAAESAGEVTDAAGGELPKSFVICTRAAGQRVWLSQLSSATLSRRSEEFFF